jgi:hypothetical protein
MPPVPASSGWRSNTGTGGKVRLLGINKRRDTFLRTLSVHGAKAVLVHAKALSQWLQDIVNAAHPM